MSAVDKHKVFISYHHDRDQWRKEELVELGERHGIFVDRSVDTGDIPEELGDEQIRVKIRDDYLQDSTVTIVLIGAETKTGNMSTGEFTRTCTMEKSTRGPGYWWSIRRLSRRAMSCKFSRRVAARRSPSTRRSEIGLRLILDRNGSAYVRICRAGSWTILLTTRSRFRYRVGSGFRTLPC